MSLDIKCFVCDRAIVVTMEDIKNNCVTCPECININDPKRNLKDLNLALEILALMERIEDLENQVDRLNALVCP